MFFRKNKNTQVNQQNNYDDSPIMVAMSNQEKIDPFIRPKLISKEIYKRLWDGMLNEKGIHIESFLTAISALGGFSCQLAARESLKGLDKLPDGAIVEVKCNNGEIYYFGETLNKFLFNDTYSFYSVTGGGMAAAGGQKHPDINEIAGYVASTIGSEKFGIPRFPEGHSYGDLPINAVKALWPAFLQLLIANKVQPIHWPMTFGLAAQQAIIDGKDVLNPELAFSMAMEVAMPMSKIDPRTIQPTSYH
jgi:hypothetical protein